MKNIQTLGLVELIELKKDREQTLYTLGFRLAPRSLFDKIIEVEREIELRVQQIQTMLSSKQSFDFIEIDMETLVPGYEDLLDFVKLQEYIRD